MAEPNLVDQDLYRQLAKGREEAFSALYERYQGPLFRFAWHMSGNSATAEDITQEVFLLLIRNPGNYDPAKGSVPDICLASHGILRGGGWIAAALTNLLRRNGRKEMNWTHERYGPAGGSGPSGTLECLQKAVLGLPGQYREVIVLCDLEEMSYPDAAVVLECPPGTISSRLHRARLMLKARLECQGCVK